MQRIGFREQRRIGAAFITPGAAEKEVLFDLPVFGLSVFGHVHYHEKSYGGGDGRFELCLDSKKAAYTRRL
jgi:hypothetical protein